MNKYSSHSGGRRGRKNKPESRPLLDQAELSELRRHKIIVGIDYGTTYSGIFLQKLFHAGSSVMT
jgi:hypothetical protein